MFKNSIDTYWNSNQNDANADTSHSYEEILPRLYDSTLSKNENTKSKIINQQDEKKFIKITYKNGTIIENKIKLIL